MEILKVQAGEAIARQKDKVNMWYLIQEGKVAQKFGFSEVILGKNAIIGILESDTFMCDYIVKEDGKTTDGYTRYGDWYGVPYGDWCAMFASFCIH